MALRPKQQRFVAEYLKDLNATQAAIRAGYKPDNANVTSSRMLANVNVAAAIAEGQRSLAARSDLSAEQILRDLETMRIQALACMQFAPAIRAAELRGKQIGMFVDRLAVKDDRLVARMPARAKDADEWVGEHGPH